MIYAPFVFPRKAEDVFGVAPSPLTRKIASSHVDIVPANFNLTVKVPRRLFYAPSPRLFFCSLRIDRRERRMKESSSPLSLPRYCDTACDDLAAVGDTHSLSLSLLLSRGAKRSWLCKTSRRCVSVGRAHRILPLQWFTTLYRPRSHVETTPATRYTLFCVP